MQLLHPENEKQPPRVTCLQISWGSKGGRISSLHSSKSVPSQKATVNIFTDIKNLMFKSWKMIISSLQGGVCLGEGVKSTEKQAIA